MAEEEEGGEEEEHGFIRVQLTIEEPESCHAVMSFIFSDAFQEAFRCFPTRLSSAQCGAASTRHCTRIRVTVEGHNGRVICDRGQCLVAISPYVSAEYRNPHASFAAVDAAYIECSGAWCLLVSLGVSWCRAWWPGERRIVLYPLRCRGH